MREAKPMSEEMPQPTGDPAWFAGLIPLLGRLGLGSSAGLLIATLRPVSWVGAQLLWVAQPTLALFGAGHTVARLARLLENDRELTTLAATLEALPREEPARSRSGS